MVEVRTFILFETVIVQEFHRPSSGGVFGGLLDPMLSGRRYHSFCRDPKFLMLACILTCSENSSTGLVSGRARDSICVLVFSLLF